jgi:DNA-binding protein YbaB
VWTRLSTGPSLTVDGWVTSANVREIDEAWIEEAVSAYRRIEERQAEFTRSLADIEVSVRSPDGLIEVVVAGEGGVRNVAVVGALRNLSTAEINRSIQAALHAAKDGADWARRRLHQDIFGEYPRLEDMGGGRSFGGAR